MDALKLKTVKKIAYTETLKSMPVGLSAKLPVEGSQYEVLKKTAQRLNQKGFRFKYSIKGKFATIIREA